MKRFLTLCIAALMLSACATINNSPSDHFRIDTVPQGALVTTSLETRESKRKRAKNPRIKPDYIGCNPTPCSIKLSRHARFIATVKHPGYEPAEIFVDSTSKQGSFAGNTAMTTATVTGTAAISAASVAVYEAFAVGIARGLVSAFVNVGSYGLISIPPSSIAITGTTSASSAAASAVPPALAVSGGMLLVDMASGANKNLFPNPVVLGLVREGEEVLLDPLAIMYRKELDAKGAVENACEIRKKSEENRETCRDAKSELQTARQTFKDFKKAYYKALQEDAKAARKAAKEAEEARVTAPISSD